MASSLAPGTVIGSFRVERLIGDGSGGAVYQATQPSLGRTVALRVLDPSPFADPTFESRFRRQARIQASIHHQHMVPIYEIADWSGRIFIAMRFVRGQSMAEMLEQGSLPPSRASAVLDAVASALAAAHAAGLVHGRVTTRNILVDHDHVYLTDFELARAGTPDGDRAALESIRAALARSAHAGRRRRVLAGAAIAAAVMVLAALVYSVRDDAEEPATTPVPAIAPSAEPLGSDLAPGAIETIGCAPEPGPNTPACTLLQTRLEGRRLIVRERGVVRQWALRGAVGDLALQVIRRRNGDPYIDAFSQLERVADAAPHVFAADVPVTPGDRIGVLLTSGAVVGGRSGQAGTSGLFWPGALPGRPRPQAATRLDRELLVRADIELGARPDLPSQLRGARAEETAPGQAVESFPIQLSPDRAARVALVRTTTGIAIDLFRGGVRRARIAVTDADARGQLLSMDPACGGRRGLCLRWQNDDEPTPLIHEYKVSRGGDRLKLIS